MYGWWLPQFIRQTADVKESFWIPAANWNWAKELLIYWTFSFRSYDALSCNAALCGLVGTIIVWCLLAFREISAAEIENRWKEFSWLALFVVSIGCCFAISFGTGRSLLQERYLLMAQAGWFVFLASMLNRIPDILIRNVCIAFLLMLGIVQTSSEVEERYQISIGGEASLQYIAEHYEAGELVLVDQPYTLNVCRYYFSRVGGDKIDVRFPHSDSPAAPGHPGHISACEQKDFLKDGELSTQRYAKIWQWRRKVFNSGVGDLYHTPILSAPAGYEQIERKDFGNAPYGFEIACYQPQITP